MTPKKNIKFQQSVVTQNTEGELISGNMTIITNEVGTKADVALVLGQKAKTEDIIEFAQAA